MLKSVGNNMHPSLTPTVVWNHSPILTLIKTGKHGNAIQSQSNHNFVSVDKLANHVLREHHASAHGGLSANGLSDTLCFVFKI